MKEAVPAERHGSKVNIEDIKRRYPDIGLEKLFPHFPRIPMSDYPELSDYSWEDCHAGAMGSGALFLASDMAKRMGLKEGMRLLDLGCGRCASSLFLARHYGVNVVAGDLWIDPSENWKRVEEAGLEGSVIPIRMEAHDIPFADGYFDAVFCMNAYHYFGTDDLYLSCLARFLRQCGRICVGGPCHTEEPTADTCKALLEEEAHSWHSPGWWQHHFEKTGLVGVLHCEEHPKGREFWLDDVRWRLERRHPREWEARMRESILQDIVGLLTDDRRFIAHLTLLAEKK